MINATLTGSTGAGNSVSAAVINGADNLVLDSNNKTLTLQFESGKPDVCVAITTATTFTVTISGNVFTVTVS